MAVSTPIVLALTFVVPATTPIAQADAQRGFGVELGNDYLSFMERGNDHGFTSDVEFHLVAAASDRALRLGMRHSIFRADTPTTRQRFDLGRLYLAGTHAVWTAGPVRLSWTHYAEGIYRGDLGGSDIQNFVHNWPGINGETFGHGLSDAYPRHPRLGVAAGLGWRADVDLSSLVTALDASWYVSSAAQLAPLATGVTKVEATTGIRLEAQIVTGSRAFTETHLAAGRAVSNDPLLGLPGGYTNELGALWGPTVVLGVRFRTGDDEWVSASFRSTRNPEGTGTRRGSGPMGWLVVEWGSSGD